MDKDMKGIMPDKDVTIAAMYELKIGEYFNRKGKIIMRVPGGGLDI